MWACLKDEWDQKRPGKWLKWKQSLSRNKVSLGEKTLGVVIGRIVVVVVDTGGIVG